MDSHARQCRSRADPSRWAAICAVAVALAATLPALASTVVAVSPWATGDHSAIRLIAGPSAEATRSAGLEIRLDPGWRTYWKAPGESGVPPAFDWSASENVAAVEVAFPAPQRFADADGVTFGYRDDVILPLVVRPKDPRRAAKLAGTMRYAVCGKICIPVEATAKLILAPGAVPDAFAAARLDGFTGRVPRPAKLGAGGPLVITSARLVGAADGRTLVVETKAPDETAMLFAAGRGVGVPRRLAPGRWRVPLERAEARIELVRADAKSAISVPLPLDELATAP
jgi:suppressor for copper-sensitivity B